MILALSIVLYLSRIQTKYCSWNCGRYVFQHVSHHTDFRMTSSACIVRTEKYSLPRILIGNLFSVASAACTILDLKQMKEKCSLFPLSARCLYVCAYLESYNPSGAPACISHLLHLSFLNLITIIIFGEEKKLCNL
jgi:hypothetical protein